MKRPPPAVRAAVLVAAIACLGLAMCTHGERARDPSFSATKAPGGLYPQAESQQAPTRAPPDSAPRPPPEYFPATKAPSQLYR